MRPDIHPQYRTVAFRDAASGVPYRTRSTVATDRTIELDGETLPLVVVDTSASSHPFRTGNQRVLDTASRVERFHQRYGARRRG
ncbi:type B 50S ribosomal protein L31 [Geodermatophilus sp. SYSU D00079]